MNVIKFVVLFVMAIAMTDAISKSEDTTPLLSVIEVMSPNLLLFSTSNGEQIGIQKQSEVPLPLPILDQKGTRLQVELLGKMLWIRQNQVRTNRVIVLRADCSPGAGNAKGKTVMATRGLGEECK